MTNNFDTLEAAFCLGFDLYRCSALQAVLTTLCGACGLGALPARADDDGFRIGGKPGRGWRLIGEKQARLSVDRDEKRVRADRAYSAIRPRVFRAPVEFSRVWFEGPGLARERAAMQVWARG